jgi:hypothetical protein
VEFTPISELSTLLGGLLNLPHKSVDIKRIGVNYTDSGKQIVMLRIRDLSPTHFLVVFVVYSIHNENC